MSQFSKKLFKGIVVKGRGVGAKLGIPTANIKLNQNYKILKFGVFVGSIIIEQKKYKAAIFIGPRMTFDLVEPVVEVAVIDFDGDLYGEEVELEVGGKIRDVEKFESNEELKAQILRDIEKAR